MSWTVKGAVLDAYALLAWLAGESGAEQVRQWLTEAEAGEATLHISLINAGEVYYRLSRLGRHKEARGIWDDLKRGILPVRLATVSTHRALAAALKASYPIAYADAFAPQLAQGVRLPLVSGDPDFAALAADGVLTVQWLPR